MSYERLFHDVHVPRFLLSLRSDLELASALAALRLERAIGVLYLPETERASHYFHARLPEQFDFVLHFDETRAAEHSVKRVRGVRAFERLAVIGYAMFACARRQAAILQNRRLALPFRIFKRRLA